MKRLFGKAPKGADVNKGKEAAAAASDSLPGMVDGTSAVDAVGEGDVPGDGEAGDGAAGKRGPRIKVVSRFREQLDSEVISKFFKRQRPVINPGEPYVIIDNVVKIYKIADLEVFALQGLDLTINKGELMAIIGASGSGKSTLLNILGGLDYPSAGKATVAGWNLNRMSSSDRVAYKRDCVGFVWQNVSRNLVPYLTALENVQLPMILKGKVDKEWAVELLESVGLGHRIKHRPMEMSGGEQQRVAIAVALANKPLMLLADEPTGSLDTKSGQQVLGVFRDIQQKYGITIILVTHDMSMANNVDRFVRIRDGKTTSETVRRIPNELMEGVNLFAEEKEETHDEYVVLDQAGRLQIPTEYLTTIGVEGNRVQLELVNDTIVIKSPKQ